MTKRVIETVNFLNRLLFDDIEYKLVDKNAKKSEQDLTSEMEANTGNFSAWDADNQRLLSVL